MESSRSISELKSLFIRTQVRILSESLEPPEDWRSYAAEPAEDDLSDKVVGDVLQKCKPRCCVAVFQLARNYISLCLLFLALEIVSQRLICLVLVNTALKQHNRAIYSSQAIQHVAQQIASLYWASISQATREITGLERGVDRTVDLSSHP